MVGASRSILRLSLTISLLAIACGEEKPPSPDNDRSRGSDPAADDEQPTDVRLVPEQDQFVLTYAGARGEFADCTTVAEVPEEARGMVGVNLLRQRPPAGKLWVTNLRTPDESGGFALQAVPREQFEELVLGAGRSSAYELPEGLELPEVAVTKDGPIIVYKTSWCGVCKQLEAYLDRKGVEYVAKDIEQDRAAAAEMAAKAKAAGVPTGSVPMIDVRGELLRGFDRARLEKLL